VEGGVNSISLQSQVTTKIFRCIMKQITSPCEIRGCHGGEDSSRGLLDL
jgi:hypothetical protein